MARTHFTLAALATSAVPGLDVVETSVFGGTGAGDFDSALLTIRDGRHLIVRLPRNQRAESEQSADLVALRALSAGVRTRLPFGVSSFVGQVPFRGTRAIVYDFVYGSTQALGALTPEHSASVGRAVAAIHTLPTSFIADAGLPVLTPVECLRAAITIIDRAAATGLVPAALLRRWERATEESKLWQFQPTVINGSLGAASFLYEDDEVTGVLGWQELRVGDPARDLFWMLGSRGETVAEAGFNAYNTARGNTDRQVRKRAMLYAELELAKWLLHGTEVRSTEIVDDAVEMLSGLAESVLGEASEPIGPQTMPTLDVDQVEDMLDHSERIDRAV
ncbi:phosphotransferase [Galbitalea soli]|uniref:Phosphotransferase n=1 Tax=Galbitalea soli TaxID=1268042 RepID=A0A7C9PM84_9MICO|nr:phosphotransferase [Galbitalea soli]NEM90589.1 phosphotransferase [Galbitalea soli]NYJ31305.1 aminoglycoside phosphotransferase (APT) family kinase protein [Galbitalea soli]